MNAPRFHARPSGCVVVTDTRRSVPSTTRNAPLPSFRNSVVPQYLSTPALSFV
jgi:hypothetical protein